MTLPFLSHRLAAPTSEGLYQICPFGEAPIEVDGHTGMQIFDQQAAEAIVANASRTNVDFLVDNDHFSRDLDKPTEAQGWLKPNLSVQSDGLYGHIALTALGKKNIVGEVYRFGSPEFERNTCVDLGGNRLRPTVLAGYSFTNRPNFKNFRPHTHRESSRFLQQLATALGYSGELSETALLAEAATAVKSLTDLKEADAETLLKNTANLPADASIRNVLKNQILQNREAGLLLLSGFASQQAHQPLHKPGQALTPPRLDHSRMTAQNEKMGIIRNRLMQERGGKAPKVDEVFSVCCQEFPDLFRD